MSELTKAVVCGHSLYWTTAYNNCVMCENAALRVRCEASVPLDVHNRIVADTIKTLDAERTSFECEIADLTAKLAAMTNGRGRIQ